MFKTCSLWSNTNSVTTGEFFTHVSAKYLKLRLIICTDYLAMQISMELPFVQARCNHKHFSHTKPPVKREKQMSMLALDWCQLRVLKRFSEQVLTSPFLVRCYHITRRKAIDKRTAAALLKIPTALAGKHMLIDVQGHRSGRVSDACLNVHDNSVRAQELIGLLDMRSLHTACLSLPGRSRVRLKKC